jgi:hypothetical protein
MIRKSGHRFSDEMAIQLKLISLLQIKSPALGQPEPGLKRERAFRRARPLLNSRQSSP